MDSSMLIDPDTIEYKWFNDRDFEVPLLLDFLKRKQPKSYLDVGAHYSWYTYGSYIRECIGTNAIYDGCDILPRPKEDNFVDRWYEGSIRDFRNLSYEFVSCISAIEHCGITTYKVENIEIEQDKVFEKLVEITESDLLVTCPFGAEGIFEGQYRNITESQAERWVDFANIHGFQVERQWLYNPFPQGKKKWRNISLSEANKIPIDKSRGIQCNMILAATK